MPTRPDRIRGLDKTTLGHEVERTVDDRLGGRLLAVAHHHVDELGETPAHVAGRVGELGVREDFSLGYFAFARHRDPR
jgi:hypothetical protein